MSFIVKNTTLPGPMDLLFPHSCRGCGHIGDALCDCCKKHILQQRHNICPNCKRESKAGKCSKCKNLPPIFIVDERSGLLDQLIHEFKYSSKRALAKPLAELLDHSLPDIKGTAIIVPLPTISSHIRSRGFDHTKKLAKCLSRLHKGWKVQTLLERANQTVQVGASKTERKKQADKAYQLNPKITIDKNATYLLIDDVWTTGSSMLAAYKKLRQAGVSQIIIGVLAVSRLKD